MNQIQTIDQTLTAQISRIEHAIAEAQTYDQLSQVIALADAAIAYARSLGKAYDEQQQRAVAAKFDAEDRLGRILLATPKAKGSRGQLAGRDFSGGTVVEPPENRAFSGGAGAEQVSTPTLKELGIDKKTAARAQAIAALPAETKQAIKAGEISVARAIAKPRPEAAEKTCPASVRVSEGGSGEFIRLRSRLAELELRIEELESTNSELASQAAETLADNESMARVFEASDQVVAALAEAKRFREMNRMLEERVRGLQNEKNAAIRAAERAKRDLDKAMRATA